MYAAHSGQRAMGAGGAWQRQDCWHLAVLEAWLHLASLCAVAVAVAAFADFAGLIFNCF